MGGEVDRKLHLIGPPRLELDGDPVRFDTRKALALLAYLSLHDPQHRDVLGDLLWPGLDTTRARAALRRTLSAMRKSLPDEALTVTRDLIGIAKGSIWVDVLAHQPALDPEEDILEARAAVEAIDGRFMDGFALRDAPAFEAWMAIERETLDRAVGIALAKLTTSLATGDREAAIRYARRRVELDPLDEPAHRDLIALYRDGGDRAAALRQYETCVRVLDEELSVSPLPETTALYDALRGEAPPAMAPPEASKLPTELPFVGRGSELAEAARSVGKEGTVVAIEGEAGIGKSRFAQELLRDRPAFRIHVHEEERDHAFGAVARALRMVFEDASTAQVGRLDATVASEVARLVPGLRTLLPEMPPATPLDGPGAVTSFFEGLWTGLEELAAPGSIIFFDDVHWIDDGTTELLIHGLRSRSAPSLSIVVTWRREEMSPEHPLVAALGSPGSGWKATILRLGRLEVGDVEELVRTIRPDEPGLAHRLYEDSAGVPFYIAEYLRAGSDATATSVVEFIRSQTARLGELAMQVLTAVAVIGRSSDLGSLTSVAGRTEGEVVEAIEELVDRGLVTERPDGYDFAHEKVRRVVYDQISLVRRRLLHARVHSYVAQRASGRPQDLAMAAFHARKAGNDAEASELYERAGVAARQLFANAEALSHLETALGLGHPDVARLQTEIGDLQTLLGRYGGALESYRSALVRSNDERWRLEHRLGSLHLRRGDLHLARTHLRAAAGACPEDEAADRARIVADLALVAHQFGEGSEAVARAEEAVRAATEAGDPAAQAQAHNILGILAPAASEAIEHLTLSVDLSATVDDPNARVAALNNLALAFRRDGQVDRAVELTQEALALCEHLGDVHRTAALHNNLADLHHLEGDGARSQEHSRRAAALFAEVGEEGVMSPEIWKLVEW